MNRGNRPELMWGLGLSEDEAARISKAAGAGFHLKNFKQDSYPWKKELEQEEKPSTAWIPLRVWNGIPKYRREAYSRLEETQRILIQDDLETRLEMEEVLEQGFLTVIRSPLTRTKVQDALFRAKEVTSLYSDIYRMTEEVLLERELLTRKTDQLMFLNKIMTSASESLETASILSSVSEDLKMLLPVKTIQAVFWHRQDDTGPFDVEMFVKSGMAPAMENQWIELLLDNAVNMGGGPVNNFQVTHLDSENNIQALSPEQGRVASLPLSVGHENFGCLLLLCDQDLRLAKDQVQTLKAAVNHLALALKNALLYKEVKIRADHDGLTRIFNRQTFDERLVDELKRHQRYSHDLSLMMVDLDHFKAINDTYGHQAGDEVLRAVASVFRKTLRTTDFPARYGGEEFAIILPHTSEADAWKLAERLRVAISERRFQSQGKDFQVTASIGVSSLDSGALTREADLLLKADQALYSAKRNGRNMVVVSGQEAMEGTIQQ